MHEFDRRLGELSASRVLSQHGKAAHTQAVRARNHARYRRQPA